MTELAHRVWDKARKINGENPNMRRLDVYGTEIQKSAYGNEHSELGWNIDHIIPLARGGSDDISNLQPLSIANNRRKADR
ncbi:MAG: HNH endonuclease [Spirochaetales bacterium]